MIKIDLNLKRKKKAIPFRKIPIPTSKLPKIGKDSSLIVAIAGISFILLEFAFLFYLNNRVSSLQEKEIQIESEISKLKEYEKKLKEIESLVSSLEQQKEKLLVKIKTFEYVAQYKKPLTPKLDLIVKNLPDGVWLENVELSFAEAKVNGYSLNPESISIYYKNLNTFYDTISFNGTEKKVSPINNIYYSFEFNLKGFKQK
ncbi:PilN domain-containing protein [Sulfurihydrogenibium azorense]|uniref:PilN domain-containing protein n=1 Tax=Sulfurihydrogenibium azorense TaxID=309806 RepID=UPI002409F2B8|nr:PilN domain-containing protein [Sulfurihydrogenibium azorense]MDM7274082.1 PilN domain-containing protein [Sulfurihydrogenibium azorense]